jgi:hypothetical protein
MRHLLGAIAAAAVTLLVAGSAVTSDAAARTRYVAPNTSNAFDGLWSVSIVTNYGDCSRAYRYPLRIVNGQILKADDDPNYQVAGVVTRKGAIGVTVAGAGQTANGTGRLWRNYGQGIWQTNTGQCSGVWTAEKRG